MEPFPINKPILETVLGKTSTMGVYQVFIRSFQDTFCVDHQLKMLARSEIRG